MVPVNKSWSEQEVEELGESGTLSLVFIHDAAAALTAAVVALCIFVCLQVTTNHVTTRHSSRTQHRMHIAQPSRVSVRPRACGTFERTNA